MALILLLCFWLGQGQASPVENQRPANTQQQAAQSPSPVIQPTQAGQAGNGGQENQGRAQWSDPLVILNFALFVAVLIQAGIYWKQLIENRNLVRQNGEAVTAMQGQLKAALDAVEMAKGQLVAMQHQEQAQYAQLEAIKRQEAVMQEQAKTMDRSLVLGTRAYLGVHSLSFDSAKKRIFLHVENIGKVPAKDIQVVVEMRVEVPESKYQAQCRNPQRYDWAKKGDERHLQIPWLFPFGRTKLFPGSLKIPIMIRLDESPYISEDQFTLIAAGQAKLSVQGFILYSDGFHSGKKTEFAFRYFLKDNICVPQPSEGLDHFQGDTEKADSDYNPS